MRNSIMTRVYWECYSWPGRTFNYTLPQILKRISNSGFDAVDLCEYPLEFWSLDLTWDDAKNLKQILTSLKLEASGITVPTFAPALELLPLKKDRMFMVERLKRAIELVSFLGGETVMYGICPCEIYGSTLEETYSWTVELFSECASLAEDKGVNIAIEFVNTCFPTTDSIMEFLEKVGSENVGVCLEVGNLRARPENEPLMQHAKKCANRVKLVHLNDPANTEWLKSMNVDLSEVVGFLKDIGYNGCLVTEGLRKSIPCPELDHEVAKAAKCMKETIESLV